VLIDQSSFAKFLLKGPDAKRALDWLAANDMDKPVGSLVYTQMLDDKGGIQCDVTVARLEEDEFYIVTGTGFATHDFDWISKNIPAGLSVQLIDVTSANGVLALMGPKSRDVLSQVTSQDVSDEQFSFAQVKRIGIAGCPVNALRVTYVGELGWELHCATEYMQTVYEAIMSAGQPLGLRNAGYRAIESCRLEKGYRAWGSDIGPDHTPLEAGLGWALKINKNKVPFKGREAIARQLDSGLQKRLVTFTVDDPDIMLIGRETIYRDGERVGWLSSGGYGHHLGQAIGYGYVRNAAGVDTDFIMSGQYQLEVATTRVDCRVHLKPLYDPSMSRIKC
jgi:4-methylaminobutanoate oxidase (formaldehyde-forming)